MSTYTTEGIIIRSRPLGDRDRLLTLFTRNQGKMSVLAKGVRSLTSRRSPYLDLLNHNIFYLSGHKLPIVTDIKPINGYHQLRQHLPHVSQLILVSELMENLLREGDVQPTLFERLEDLLKLLIEKSNCDYLPHYSLRFELQLLHELGYFPELEVCVVCRSKLQPQNLWFAHSLGGVVCGSCSYQRVESLMPLSSVALKVMRYLVTGTEDQIRLLAVSSHVRREIHQILALYVSGILEHEPTSFEVLNFLDSTACLA